MADDAAPTQMITLTLLTNWCYTKMAKQDIILHTILITPYCLQKIIKIGSWLSKIQQAKAVRFRDTQSMSKKPNFRGSRFPRWCIDISQERWDNKWPFDSVLTRQYICQKLIKSVDVRWSYSVQRQCVFVRHSVLMSHTAWSMWHNHKLCKNGWTYRDAVCVGIHADPRN